MSEENGLTLKFWELHYTLVEANLVKFGKLSSFFAAFFVFLCSNKITSKDLEAHNFNLEINHKQVLLISQ